ncbi:MAG: hypothetical protein JXM68_02240, partial [Sedimentisphaerales bacterium]|nr:hypothetical protein [Sedimentisphaerales bacterium]
TSTGSATVSATIDTLYASEGNTVIIEAWMQPAGDTGPILLTAGSTAQGSVNLVANTQTSVSLSMLPVEDNLFVLQIDETGAMTQYGVDLWEYANSDQMTFFQVYLPGDGVFILGFDTKIDLLELSPVDILLYESDGRRVPLSPSGYTVSKTASVSRESPCRITISDGTPRTFIVGIPAQPAETAINYFVDLDFQTQLELPVFTDFDGNEWVDDNDIIRIVVNAPIDIEHITLLSAPVSETASVQSNFEGGVLTLSPPEGEYWQSGAYLSLELIDTYYYRARSIETDSLNNITALVFVSNDAAAGSGTGTRSAPYASLAEAEIEISLKAGEYLLPIQVLLAASATEYSLSGTTGFTFNSAPAHFSGGWNTDFSAGVINPEATKINAGTTGIYLSVASEVFPEGLRNLTLYTDGVVLDGVAAGYNHALVAVLGDSSAVIRDCVLTADNIELYENPSGSSVSFSLIHFETSGTPVLANSKLKIGTTSLSASQLCTFYIAALDLGSASTGSVIILGSLLDAGNMQWLSEPDTSPVGSLAALSLGTNLIPSFIANKTFISGFHTGITSGVAQGAAAVAGYAAADYHFVNNIFAVTPTTDGKT